MDDQDFDTATIFHGMPLQNSAALAAALSLARSHFNEFGLPQPPIPDNAAGFSPCTLLITERHNLGTGERIGRIRFLRNEVTTLFDQEWSIAKPRRRAG